MTTTADIAQTVTEVLNAGDFSQEFTAVRTPLAQVDLEEGDLHVLVMAKDFSAEISSRDSLQFDHQVDVGVLKRLDAVTNETVDTMQALLREIGDKFLGKGLSVAERGAVCIKAEVKTLASPDHLKSESQYLGLVTFTFRMMEAVA